MLAYALRRVATVVPVMLIVATFAFRVMRLGASDPAPVMAGEGATPDQLAAIRAQYGFDQPIAVRFLR